MTLLLVFVLKNKTKNHIKQKQQTKTANKKKQKRKLTQRQLFVNIVIWNSLHSFQSPDTLNWNLYCTIFISFQSPDTLNWNAYNHFFNILMQLSLSTLKLLFLGWTLGRHLITTVMKTTLQNILSPLNAALLQICGWYLLQMALGHNIIISLNFLERNIDLNWSFWAISH